MEADEDLRAHDESTSPRAAAGAPPGSERRSEARAPRPTAAARAPRGAPPLDRAVREGLRERRPEALAAFHEAYFERIYGYVRRLVRDEHLAEDLTQDVLMHLYRAFPGYDPARDLRPWVFTIATNKLRDFWQSRRFQDERGKVSLDDEHAEPLAPQEPRRGPRGELEAGELAGAVAEAIERLPEALRLPFWLRWHEELSFADIAAQLGRSEVAVRKRYSRALAELRRLLEGWLPPPPEADR